MDPLEVKKQIDGIAEQIDKKLEGIASDFDAKGKEATKSVMDEVNKLVGKHGELQKHIDDMATAMARKGGSFGAPESAHDMLAKMLQDNDGFKGMVANQGKGRATIKTEEKAILTTPAVGPAGLVQPQRVGTILVPQRTPNVLDLIPVAPTGSNSIEYARETAYTGNGAYVPEGTMKPEDGFTFDTAQAPIKTLATTLRVTKQMFDDVQGLVGYIQARAPRRLEQVKERNVLFGNGSATQLQGIVPLASAFAAPTVLPGANEMDVLYAAILQASLAEYDPSGIVVHISDLFKMQRAKDGQGRYLFPELNETGTLNGVRIVPTKLADMAGKFLAGDFGIGAQLFQRQGLTIEFFDQDRDNVPLNLITIRIEERHGLAVYRPDAFVYGTFSTAVTDLAS